MANACWSRYSGGALTAVVKGFAADHSGDGTSELKVPRFEMIQFKMEEA